MSKSTSTSVPTIFTVANARKATGPLSSVTDVKAALQAKVKVSESLKWDAALALWFAVNTAQTVSTSKAKGKQTLTDYAGNTLGLSASSASLYLMLGQAAVVHGVREGSPMWRFLGQRATAARVAEVLRQEKSAQTTEALDGLLNEYRRDPKASFSKKGAARPLDGGEAERGEGSAQAPAAPAPVKAATFDDVIAAVRAMIGDATPLQVSTLWEIVDNAAGSVIAEAV